MAAPVEFHDVRIQGSYSPVGSTAVVAVDRVFRLAGQVDEYGVTNSVQATAQLQDITPSFTQAAAGEAGFNVVSPIASDVYSAITGTHGLEDSSDQPGDLTRVFYATADVSRAHHVSCQRSSSVGASVFAGGPGPSGVAAQPIMAVSDGGDGIPSIVADEGGGAYGLYTLDPSTGVFTRLAAAWNIFPTVVGTHLPNRSAAAIDAARLVRHRAIGAYYWLPVAGLSQLKEATTGATVAADAEVWFTQRLGDRLHAFSCVNGITAITPYDISAFGATLTWTLNSAPAPVVGVIVGTGALVGACVSNGFIILATERGLWSVAFDDTNKKYITAAIVDLPGAVTGKPIEWGGDVWVPCGPRLFRFTVGKSGNTWPAIDVAGNLPAVYGAGEIVQLVATPDRLVARVVARDRATAVLVTIDAGGAVATLEWSDIGEAGTVAPNTGVAEWAVNPMILAVGYMEPYILRMRSVLAGAIVAWDTTIVPAGTINPAKLAAGSRRGKKATAMVHFPRNYGGSRHAAKTPVRLGVEVSGVGPRASGLTIDPYLQWDEDNLLAVQTFGPYGPLGGTGTWQSLGQIGRETPGIDAISGGGIAWFELTDAAGNYRRARSHFTPLVVINGDGSGLYYPELRSLIVQRYEWVFKGYLSSLRLRLATTDGNADPSDWRRGGVFERPDDVEAALADLKALNDHNAICTVTPIGGDDTTPYRGVLTKYNEDTWHVDASGRTYVIVQLSVQHVVPAALYPGS